MERLRAAEDGRERLKRGADDVVVRLLPGERAAGGLGVEAKRPGARIFGAVAFLHGCTRAAGGAILGDFLEKVGVRVEEEAEARHEFVDREAPLESPIDVFEAVAKSEREFLKGRGAGFADVIAADGNGIELGRVLTPNSKVSVTRRMEGRAGRCIPSARCIP